MTKLVDLGRAKPDSRMFKRGYTVNLVPNPKKKPASATKPPASPDRKKNSGE
jgi:hypothetical protein